MRHRKTEKGYYNYEGGFNYPLGSQSAYLSRMKHLRVLLVLSLVAFAATATVATADSFDSDTATIKKAGPSTATVMVDKGTYKAPISFTDGADWSTVKDHYEVSPVVVSSLKAHKLAIAIGSDGTASFTRKK